MNKIYIFSGLGVDKRVFKNIDFTDLSVSFIDWIPPLKEEPLKNYAKRISERINTENPILMGLSFGGMVVVEISKIIKTKKVILIASAKNKNELPISYRIARILKINKLVPNSILKISNFFTNWLFGIEAESEKKLLKTIMKETDSQFLTWAINEIINWENEENPENFIHIHGSKDRLIPIKNVKANFIIENAGHFMTINRAKEIEAIIRNACK